MTRRTAAALILMLFCAAMTSGVVYAGSMLTTPPVNSNDGSLSVIGEKSCAEDISEENVSEDILYVNIKQKMDKIWGAQIVQKKIATEKDEGTAAAAGTKEYPKILVRYTPKATKSTAYKYKHIYTSRHKGKTVTQMDITPIIVREAKKNNIAPELLKGVIQTESNFNPFATSPAGAMGLCQLMPGTARMLGVKDPYCPEQSIMGGAKYLGMMKRMFKSTDLALAAYNAGPGAVSRHGGVPNYRETRNYIVKVRKNMKW